MESALEQEQSGSKSSIRPLRSRRFPFANARISSDSPTFDEKVSLFRTFFDDLVVVREVVVIVVAEVVKGTLRNLK